MKRIVNSEEMKFCDSNTIRYFGVPAIVLMERAALCVMEEAVKIIPAAGRILIVCGSGNNGADGLAVARLLHQRGYEVVVVQAPDHGKRTQENQMQRDILEKRSHMACRHQRIPRLAYQQQFYSHPADSLSESTRHKFLPAPGISRHQTMRQ